MTFILSSAEQKNLSTVFFKYVITLVLYDRRQLNWVVT